MKNARPLLLLDVDGVLNPFDMNRNAPAPGFVLHHITVRDGRTFPVLLNPAHGEWLNSLSADFDLVWATTWSHEANELIGPKIGLAALPVIEPVRRGLYRIEKFDPARKFVAGRPFAWLDDSFEYGVPDWARRRNGRWYRSLLVRPDPAIGLTLEHIQTLRDFAAQLKAHTSK
jgi:hypothetical protein